MPVQRAAYGLLLLAVQNGTTAQAAVLSYSYGERCTTHLNGNRGGTRIYLMLPHRTSQLSTILLALYMIELSLYRTGTRPR